MAALTHSRTCTQSRSVARASGFTLVELAMVMFIIALLLGGMLMPLSAQQDVRARQETEKQLADIRDALYGFAALNGRLPRPATSATDGAENPASCATDAACSGFIPWASLGVNGVDAWGKRIRYSVTPAFANGTVTTTAIPNRTVQTRDAGGNAVYLAGGVACNTASQCVPAVVFSQGKQRQGTSSDGTAVGAGTGTSVDETANDTGPLNYFSRLATDNTGAGGGEFDDQLIWISSNALFNRLINAGKL